MVGGTCQLYKVLDGLRTQCTLAGDPAEWVPPPTTDDLSYQLDGYTRVLMQFVERMGKPE